jgi:hypothetical protein
MTGYASALNRFPRKPVELLDYQVALYEHTMSDFGLQYLESFFESVGLTTKEAVMNLVAGLRQADTYWLTEKISRIIHGSLVKWPLNTVLNEYHLPTHSGFVWMEQPIVMRDIRRRTAAIRAFLWVTANFVYTGRQEPERGVIVFWYSDALDPQDSLHTESESAAHVVEAMRDNRITRLSLYHTSVWRFGNRVRDLYYPDEATYREHMVDKGIANPSTYDEMAEENRRDHSFLMALWAWMQQKIARVDRERPDRATARRWNRGMLGTAEVNVVTLREDEPAIVWKNPYADPSPILWSHRWRVRGHYRNQYYPSTGEYHLIWIESFIKGPEDRPLLEKDTLYVVKR